MSTGNPGNGQSYKPLDWGCSPTAEPIGFVKAIAPKNIYIADLDRIEGTGSHDRVIAECARQVSACYADRGCRSPDDFLSGYHITNIVGTETGGEDLSQYGGGFLSLDMKNGRVIPSGREPVDVLRQANGWKFEGCIILNIGAVGTETGLNQEMLEIDAGSLSPETVLGRGCGCIADPEHAPAMQGLTVPSSQRHYITKRSRSTWIRRGQVC